MVFHCWSVVLMRLVLACSRLVKNTKIYKRKDPTGTMIKYDAKGIGPAEESIQDTLKESYKGDLSLDDTEKLALLCLKKVMEEEVS